MNPEIKQKWLTALRSGEIKQRTGNLCGTDGTCCAMGVLAKVLEKDGKVVISPSPTDKDAFKVQDARTATLVSGSRVSLPEKVLDDIQLCCGAENTVMALNDSSKASFAQIADYIETNL